MTSLSSRSHLSGASASRRHDEPLAQVPLTFVQCHCRASRISRNGWSAVVQVADQPATLTMEPTVVLFGDTRHAHNAPNLWLTTQIRHQRSQQSLDVTSVRLGSARPTINLHTRRIDDIVAYALRFEQTVEPEAVIARFVATNHIHAFLQFSSNARPNPLAQLQKLLPIAGFQRVAANLVRQRCVDCDNPTFLAQFDCKKTPYGVIMGCGGRQAHCPVFHQSISYALVGSRNRDGNLRPSRLHRIYLRYTGC